jgi:NitT/TauT family transport system substrate-binding protein
MKASLCSAPAYVAEDLLHGEGFTEIEYLDDDPHEIGTSKLVATGEADLNMSFGLTTLVRVDAGEPVVMLGGVHAGCYELFANESVQTVRDLRGRKVAIPGLGSSQHLFLSIIASYVRLNAKREITWVVVPRTEAKQQFIDGKVDAYLGFPPEPEELRAQGIGHVVLNSTTDRPWSQYFCCMVIGNRNFVRRNPVATKRALRALLKATDICATQPARSAALLFEKNYVKSREAALQTLSDVQYRKWREYNPEDSVRFFALRLREAGMVKSTPQSLITQGTDWRFFDALRKELRA